MKIHYKMIFKKHIINDKITPTNLYEKDMVKYFILLPSLVKYFILLETTAVLSLESKYANIVVSSQSSATMCLIKTIKAVNKQH